MNSVQLIGRLTHDPRSVFAGKGSLLATMRLAVPGIRDDEVHYVTIKTWGRTAQAALEHLSRGRRVAIQGRLEQHEWSDDSGNRNERLAVVADRVEYLDAAPRRQLDDQQAEEVAEHA